MVLTSVNGVLLTTAAARFPKNPLLSKDSVGKRRPTVYDLPPEDHVYGIQVERDPNECAAMVLQHWNIRETSKDAVPALDYITMNRNSAKRGIISPKDIRKYRDKNPVRIKVQDHTMGIKSLNSVPGAAEVKRGKGPLPSDRNANFTYGKPTRPSTPVAYLMTDRFQKEWIMQHEKHELELMQIEREKLLKKHHNVLVPRKQSPKKEQDSKVSEFIMSKFKNIKAKIVTKRDKNDPVMIKLKQDLLNCQIKA